MVFIDETWIRTVKDEGPALGLAGYADKITKTAEGRYVIANAKDRDAILDLRRDPKISALMAGAFSRRNEERLAAGIGRAPTSGELYIAHLLGAGEQLRHRLGHDVSRRVSQDMTTFVALAGDDGYGGAIGQLATKVPLVAIHDGSDCRLGET